MLKIVTLYRVLVLGRFLMSSIEQTWQTLAALPIAIIMFDQQHNRFYFNLPAQSLFSIEEQLSSDELNLTHLALNNALSSESLGITDLLPSSYNKYPLFVTLTNRRTQSAKLLDLKFATLCDSLYITVCEPRTLPSQAQSQDFDELISQISTELIDIQNENMSQQIEKALQTIGLNCHADRTYIFEFSDDGLSMSNTYEWVNDGITPFKEHLQNIPKDSLPYFFQQMHTQHIFNASNTAELPPEASAEKMEFTNEGIQSVICIGLVVEKTLFGFIGCDCVNKARQWSQTDLLRIKLVGDMITNALKNMQYKNKLEKIQKLLLAANKELHEQAHRDSLTEIANRRQLDTTLQQELKRCARSRLSLSLILCDIDSFKLYNDTLGHQQGDQALKHVAKTLEENCQRPGDLAARYGGEEFAIILPATNKQEAFLFCQKLQLAIKRLAIKHPNSKVNPLLTLSFGIYSCQPNAHNVADHTLIMADKALYRAKQNGRNRIEEMAE